MAKIFEVQTEVQQRLLKKLLRFHDSVEHLTVPLMICLTVFHGWGFFSSMWYIYLENSTVFWDVSLDRELLNESRNLINQVVTSRKKKSRGLHRKLSSTYVIISAVFEYQNSKSR